MGGTTSYYDAFVGNVEASSGSVAGMQRGIGGGMIRCLNPGVLPDCLLADSLQLQRIC